MVVSFNQCYPRYKALNPLSNKFWEITINAMEGLNNNLATDVSI